jgi:nucleoid-associated protein YgaU
MGLISFFKDAGEKLFGKKVQEVQAAPATTSADSKAEANREAREKVILAAGNVHGVSGVEDMMTVDLSQPPAQFYTVVKGDTLSKIAKQFYGNPNEYPRIFEANRPMLSHPDKIYPGQNLRIPPKG